MREFIIYQDKDGLWIAECREIQGFRATGRTKREAIEKIKAALLMYKPCRCEDLKREG